jgi:O-antigen/teichoic acid export membrane protein
VKRAGAPADRGETHEDSPPSLTHRAMGGMIWVAWGSGAVGLLKVAVLVILTRLLTPADFGVVTAALVVINFSLNFSQVGLGPALVQRPVLEPRHTSTGFLASAVFGLLLAAITWLAAPLIAQFFRMDHLTPVVRALAIIFIISGVATVPESLLQRNLRFRFIANRDLFAYAVSWLGVGVGLALLGWGPWSLVVAQLTQVTIRTAILLRAAPSFLTGRPTWASFVELMEYGVGQSITRMGFILANQADNLVVGRWLGAAPLGIYSRAYQFMQVPTGLVADVLDKVLFPTMARVQDDLRRLASAYLRATTALVLVMLPIGVVAAVLAPELVAVVFGRRWQALVSPFQILALGMVLRAGIRMSDSLSRATGKVYRRAWRQWLYAGLVFLGAWVGLRGGVTGVAAGVLCALCINYLMMAQLSLSVIQVSWTRFAQAQLPALRLTLVIALVTAATAAGIRHFGLPPLLGLIAGIVVALGTAALMVSLAPTIALGRYGMRMRDTLRSYLLARLRPARARGPA